MKRLSFATLAIWAAAASPAAIAQLPYEGYTVFQPMNTKDTIAIDNNGTLVHTWPGEFRPGFSVYMLDDGTLLRSTRLGNTSQIAGGGFQHVAPDGTVLWDYRYANPRVLHHHDIEHLPNGNVLMIAWEFFAPEEAIAQGRNPQYMDRALFAPDHIIEVKKTGPTTGEIVWEWHVWDHLIQDFDPSLPNYGVVADHPELINLNYPPEVPPNGDWNHLNAIDYNAELDQILLCTPFQDEIWIIDHSTTTEEAKGHSGGKYGRGGDLLYRWGNPEAYDHGGPGDQVLFGQHDAQWIPRDLPGETNILIFNNGPDRPQGQYSSVDELIPPVDANGFYTYVPGQPYGPTDLHWTYVAPVPTDFYSPFISGSQRLANGNTLVCCGPEGYFFEVTKGGKIVWDYTEPTGDLTFRVRRYSLCNPQTYCTAKSGLVCGTPEIGFSGTSSASSSSGFEIVSKPALGARNGVLLYSLGERAALPFQGGTLCVDPADLQRAAAVQSGGTSGACDGEFRLDMNAFAQGLLGGSPDAGLSIFSTRVHAQWWGRDSVPTGSYLSNAVEYFVCP